MDMKADLNEPFYCKFSQLYMKAENTTPALEKEDGWNSYGP